jgi:hypothetical protein
MNRILIVEDDEAIATGLALNLKLAGRDTTIARDGEDAIRQTQDEDFALVLLDINLPKKNGLEVLSTLRASDNIVPVIVLSARDSTRSPHCDSGPMTTSPSRSRSPSCSRVSMPCCGARRRRRPRSPSRTKAMTSRSQMSTSISISAWSRGPALK